MSAKNISAEEKIQSFKEIFSRDPLFQKIEQLGLDDKFFSDTDFFEELTLGFDYTTSQATDLLKVGKNQAIINLLNRHDLKSYFEVVQSTNGYYSYNHIVIFQLKMVFFLLEHKHQPLDIASIIGTKTQIARGDKNLRKRDPLLPEVSNEHIKEIVQKELESVMIQLSAGMQKQLKNQHQNYISLLNKTQIESDIKLWETEMKSLVAQIETLEFQERIIKTHPKVEKGLLSKLFGKDTDNENEKDKQQILEAILEKKQKLVSEKEALSEKKEFLLLEQSKIEKLIEDSKTQQTGLINTDNIDKVSE